MTSEITTDIPERVCPNCGGIGDLHWPTCQPAAPRVCQRGVDGSEALTPKEALDTLMRILLLLDSADNYEGVLPKARVLLRGVIGHWGDSSPPIEQVEMHEFVGQYGLGNEFCAFPVGLYQCLQPRAAPVHKVASEPQDVCAQCESNARDNEAGGYRELAAECRAYCRRGHRPQPIPPPVSELGAFWKTWCQATGEHATARVIYATTTLVLAEREIAVRNVLAPIEEALEACVDLCLSKIPGRVVLLEKSKYEALVAAIKGEK